jgi:hypothetical protein
MTVFAYCSALLAIGVTPATGVPPPPIASPLFLATAALARDLRSPYAVSTQRCKVRRVQPNENTVSWCLMLPKRNHGMHVQALGHVFLMWHVTAWRSDQHIYTKEQKAKEVIVAAAIPVTQLQSASPHLEV